MRPTILPLLVAIVVAPGCGGRSSGGASPRDEASAPGPDAAAVARDAGPRADAGAEASPLELRATVADETCVVGVFPRFEVTLTNVGDGPLTLLEPHASQGGRALGLRIAPVAEPDRYAIYTWPMVAETETFVLAPGSSRRWELPPPGSEVGREVREGSFLAGRYEATVTYAIRPGDEDRFPGRGLWQGVVGAEPVGFEVVDDGDPRVVRLRAARSGAGLDQLRLHLAGAPLRVRRGEPCQLTLSMENRGGSPLSVGSRYGLTWRHAGEERSDFGGPRSGMIELPSRSRREVGGWAFAQDEPGTYEVFVTYRAEDAPERVVRSNVLTVTVLP